MQSYGFGMLVSHLRHQSVLINIGNASKTAYVFKAACRKEGNLFVYPIIMPQNY